MNGIPTKAPEIKATTTKAPAIEKVTKAPEIKATTTKVFAIEKATKAPFIEKATKILSFCTASDFLTKRQKLRSLKMHQ